MLLAKVYCSDTVAFSLVGFDKDGNDEAGGPGF